MQKPRNINKILIIVASILAVIAIISIIIFFVLKSSNEQKEISYEDKINASTYFEKISIDYNTKEVKRDDEEIILKDEFGISEEQEKIVLNSIQELQNLFSDTTYDLKVEDNIVYIRNAYQTKKIIVEYENLKEKQNFDAENQEEIQDGIYVLAYDTQVRTKAAYNYFKSNGISVFCDEISKVETINDVSQTVYGASNDEEEMGNSWGLSAMGMENYKNIINENQNTKDIVVSTIGYGAKIENEFLNGRITNNYYNFMKDSQDVSETLPQGSRILEVIADSTTDNVKIMPLVVVDENSCTSVVCIIKAIVYATQSSDVICYELVNNQNELIDKVLSNAFKENKPVCCVNPNLVENKDIYPANNATTIAVSSIDKNKEISNYSGKGEYIDFAASSTDIKEIFDNSSKVSRWSGPQYSNASIVSQIALIKSYNKDYTILEIYNILRNYCEDLGEKGKDKSYGYGMPNFSEITIADIDKESPKITGITYDNENWEKTKKVKITGTDNIRILGWQITQSEGQPASWNNLEQVTPNLDVETEIKENGKYYVWISDTAGNMEWKEIEVNKVDNTEPTITTNIDTSTLSNGYVIININSEDKESGLADSPYSWDNASWGAVSNILKVTENGVYTIYVRDKMDNVANKEIKVNYFANEGTADIGDGIIIQNINVSSEWDGDTNNNVQIIFNRNIDIIGWQITTVNSEPSYFNSINLNVQDEEQNQEIDNTGIVQANSNLQINATLNINTDYYVWVKDLNGNVYGQSFKINKVEF